MKSQSGRVFRVQKRHRGQKFGLGPYREQTDGSYTVAWYSHGDNVDRPTWRTDTGVRPTKALWFGFKSLDQLYTWFDEEDCLIDLRERGYYIAVFDGHVIHRPKQSVILANKPSSLVRTLKL